MDDNDSIITDISILGTPNSFKHLPKSADNSIHTEDLTSSSSDAVIKALQTLQQKIKKLELERIETEKKFGTLEKETNDYKEIIKSKDDLKENKAPMYRLQPTSSSTPDTTMHLTPDTTMHLTPDTTMHVTEATSDHVTVPLQPKAAYNIGGTYISSLAKKGHASKTYQKEETGKRALYCPSSSQPYATYIRPIKEDKAAGDTTSQKLYDSRVSVLEKQLEYMRRLVNNAEQERMKATEKMCSIELEKENKLGKITQDELEKQNGKICELERECSKLSTAHFHAQGKITDLESRLQNERESHIKLIHQTEELARATEENKNMMMSMSPSLPPSPPLQPKKKKKRKRPSSSGSSVQTCSTGAAVAGAARGDWRAAVAGDSRADWKAMPFVCGSAHPSHSLSANVQQMLSVLKQENPSLCARITTQKRKKLPGKEIKQVIQDLEDDLGALTFECQKLTSAMSDSADKRKLQEQLDFNSDQMEKKSQQIKKLKSYLKKVEKEPPGRVALAQPVSRPFSTLNNREVQISVRGRNTRELLSKVKSIRDVLTNKDIQWI